MREEIQNIDNLSIGFRSQKGEEIAILKNITTNIYKGETVGIVGESGSGKSTLALAMMGYTKQGLYPISGSCVFKDKNLSIFGSPKIYGKFLTIFSTSINFPFDPI